MTLLGLKENLIVLLFISLICLEIKGEERDAGGLICGHTTCHAHHRRFCSLRHGGWVCDEHCDEHHKCEHTHVDHHGHQPDCCCATQDCINAVTSSMPNHWQNQGVVLKCGQQQNCTTDRPFCALRHDGLHCDDKCDIHKQNCDHAPIDPHTGQLHDCCCDSQSCADKMHRQGLTCGQQNCTVGHPFCALRHDGLHCDDKCDIHKQSCDHVPFDPHTGQLHDCCCDSQTCADNMLRPDLKCGQQTCTGDHPFCVLRQGTLHCDNRCDIGPQSCDHAHVDPHTGQLHDCCCNSQNCVDNIFGPTTNPSTLSHTAVMCHICGNKVNPMTCLHDLSIHQCAASEVCEVVTNTTDIVSTTCKNPIDCVYDQLGSSFNNVNQVICCNSLDCVVNAHLQVATATTPPIVQQTQAVTSAPTAPQSGTTPLHCPSCRDGFITDCQQNAVCATNEGCMLQVIDGRLQTGCHEVIDCEYHERIGDSICCKDKNCTDNAFKNMNDMSFTCPSCKDAHNPHACLTNQNKCSYLSQGCHILHNINGFTSGCTKHPKSCQLKQSQNSPLCNVNPIPFAYERDLQCSFCCHKNSSTCILDAFGVHEQTTVGTTASGFGNQGPSTIKHTARTTTPIPVQNQCADKDSSCPGLASFLCTSTNPNSQLYAREHCAKTCNLCGQVSSSVTVPGQTCVDHDANNNCAKLSHLLCTSTDSHTKNFAIANCAKTCNLCTEYFHHLAGLTIPFAG